MSLPSQGSKPRSQRSRGPDVSLYPQYVKALQLKERGKSLKQIRDLLFRGENLVAAERKAELYVQNGKLLICGKSHLIGQR
jgi:hypothetical protein